MDVAGNHLSMLRLFRYKSLEQNLHVEKERLRSGLEAAQEEKAKLMRVRKGLGEGVRVREGLGRV